MPEAGWSGGPEIERPGAERGPRMRVRIAAYPRHKLGQHAASKVHVMSIQGVELSPRTIQACG